MSKSESRNTNSHLHAADISCMSTRHVPHAAAPPGDLIDGTLVHPPENQLLRAMDAADVMLKLLNVLPHLEAATCVCDMMNTFARIAVGNSIDVIGEGRTLSQTLRLVLRFAESSFDTPNIALVDLLRTACFVLGDKERSVNLEYTKQVRCASDSSSYTSELVVRDGGVNSDDMQAYSSGEQMQQNMQDGMRALRALANQSHAELGGFVETSAPQVSSALNMMVIPSWFDGGRMKLGLAIACKYIGCGTHNFGYGSESNLVLNADGSNMSLARVLYTFCCFVAMARSALLEEAVVDGMVHGISKARAKRLAQESVEWKVIDGLVSSVRETMSKKRDSKKQSVQDGPGGIAVFMSTFTDWLEASASSTSGVHSYKIIHLALSASVFQIGDVPAVVGEVWRAYTARCGMTTLCLWGAAVFVCDISSAMHDDNMSLLGGILTVLSGAVGRLMNGNISGPFVFDCKTTMMIAKVYLELNSRVELSAARRQVRRKKGSRCGMNQIFERVLDTKAVRSQHDKCRALTETRLGVCLANMAAKEALQSDLGGCSHPPVHSSEGRKQLKRMYLIYFMCMPCAKRCWNFHDTGVSYLIESREGVETHEGADACIMTTVGNVANPLVDTEGVSLISTIFFPVAKEAFLRTTHTLFSTVAQQKYATSHCVDTFLRHLVEVAEDTFDPDTRLLSCEHECESRRVHAVSMMQQQLNTIRSLAKVLANTGMLWQKLQITFSTYAPKSIRKRGREEETPDAACSDDSEDESDSLAFNYAFPS